MEKQPQPEERLHREPPRRPPEPKEKKEEPSRGVQVFDGTSWEKL